MIDVSMRQFLVEHPDCKYLFFGGKGGVGKTVMAGAAALWIAGQGKRTLLASTNPVSMAQRTIWARLVKPSLERMLAMCDSTVRLLNTNSSAISSFDLAWATRLATSRSRGVKASRSFCIAAAFIFKIE